MIKDYPGERWKTIEFDIEFTNKFRIEVSNFGRLRTFNKISNGNIIKGSITNGYRVVRLKLYKHRDEKIKAKLDNLQQQVFELARKLKSQINEGENEQVINETSVLLDTLKKKVSKKFQQDLKERTINHQSLIHRLVAEYFLPKPASGQTIVGHLDHDKLNNRAHNLKWMTPEENYEHQKNSPRVIEDQLQRQQRQQSNPNRAKLTVTRVMLLKKLLNEGKPMKQLVKLFKVTETQIIRIKRGENWSNIQTLN
ncbi:HNH endonuclease [Segetibacter sp.]|uniref:HNH endonuclease n=1 Tax=Segetibacter sp. TaxID=2231182 RepID=UPI00260D5F37|nr:HNH endonuclease [Segetibacter sp.]MCW3081070.1 numod4 domain protein [Segetibacter sp.]